MQPGPNASLSGPVMLVVNTRTVTGDLGTGHVEPHGVGDIARWIGEPAAGTR